jgi:outer membrane protein OmpA-like peptidoglycan-associated protein
VRANAARAAALARVNASNPAPAPPRAPAIAPPPLVPPPSAAPAAPPERLGFVLFRYGDFWVGPKSHATLLEMLPRMAADRRPIHRIGHADALGTPSVNRRISEARAHAVARVLIEDGVAEDRIRISGVGSDGQDESALARRVELQVEDMP